MRPQPVPPGPGQESVWSYPRPPRIEPAKRRLRVVFAGLPLADTQRGLRALETSHPPVYYFPPDDVKMSLLVPTGRRTFCEFKGWAAYFDVVAEGRREEAAAWIYEDVTPGYEAIRGWPAFYPRKMDACLVDDERARPQPGGFYAGWITNDVVGPFKGEPGTMFW